jgi:hypothetical protein
MPVIDGEAEYVKVSMHSAIVKSENVKEVT